MFDPDGPLLARVRALALGLPGADEKESHGRPAFFTKKVFAYYGAATRSDGAWGQHGQAVVFLPDPGERPALEADPRFWVPAYLGPAGWLGLDLDERTDLLVESFPRCASSFALAAITVAQAPSVLRVAHHTHAPANVLRAIDLAVPALVLIRAPEDVAVSNMVRHPRRTPNDVLRGFLRFYESEVVPKIR
jgi:hypothetical protein